MKDTFEGLQKAVKDKYTIEREVGRGGMAVVFLARDVRHDRRTALKVLRPELSASIGAERFLREIQIEASLHHPHILPLYDSGRVNGTLYYTMPYVEGETLRQRFDEAYRVASVFDSPGGVSQFYPVFLRPSLQVRLDAVRGMGDEAAEQEVEQRLRLLEAW